MSIRRVLALSLPLAIVLAAGAHADMYLVNRIDLNRWFGPLGTNPMCVTSDGTWAYIGGYNNTATTREIGVLKIRLDVTVPTDPNAPLPDPNAALVLTGGAQTVDNWHYYGGIVYHNGVVYALCDRPQGTNDTSNLRALDATTGALVPSFGLGGILYQPGSDLGAGSSNYYIGGLAFDPGVGGVDSGLSLLVSGSGRRMLLDPATGATLYGPNSNIEPRGMVIVDVVSTCTKPSLTNYRKHVYAPNGDIFFRHANQLAAARRSGGNACDAWPHMTDAYNLDGTNFVDCGDGKPVQMGVGTSQDGQFLGLIPATSPYSGGQDLIIFNDRPTNTPPTGQTWPFVTRIKVVQAGLPADPNGAGALPSPAFNLLKADGTPLTAAEAPDGIGLYDFCYTSNDLLLVLDFGARKLLVFGAPTATGACCQPEGSCAVTTQASCTGVFQGAGTTCTPNPCAPPTGACCVHGVCTADMTEAACTAAGGMFQGLGSLCTPDTCACLGDGNCDHVINWRDIDFLIAGQNDNVSAWTVLFPAGPTCPFLNLDTSGDGHVNWRDIDPFIALMNTTCP
jgi:hypothetical protein